MVLLDGQRGAGLGDVVFPCARPSGRPRAWKDYVAKARAALTAEPAESALADDEDSADSDPDDPPDDTAAADDAPDSAPDATGGDDEDALTPAELIARLAELAAADPDALQAAHDALAALGASCDPDNCPDADAELDKVSGAADLARLADAALADLAKALPRVEALERRLDAQADLIERLGATPAPPRTAASTHAIGKTEDADPAADMTDLSAAEAQKAFAVLTPDERAFLLMKASLRRPIPLP